MLKSICNVACQRLVGKVTWRRQSSEPAPRRVSRFRAAAHARARIKLAATKLITFGYFQLVAAQLSSCGQGGQRGVAGSCLHARPKRWLNIRRLLLKRKPQWASGKKKGGEKKPPKSETKRSFSGEKLRAANGSDNTTTTRRRWARRKGKNNDNTPRGELGAAAPDKKMAAAKGKQDEAAATTTMWWGTARRMRYNAKSMF